MNIENQVCTLEQAKKLKELGIEMASAYNWYRATRKKTGEAVSPILSTTIPFDLRIFNVDQLPAYTTSELGVMLPEELLHPVSIYLLTQWTYCEKGFINDFRLIYKNNRFPENTIPNKPVVGRTEADVRAKMLICLIDEYKYHVELIHRRCQFIK